MHQDLNLNIALDPFVLTYLEHRTFEDNLITSYVEYLVLAASNEIECNLDNILTSSSEESTTSPSPTSEKYFVPLSRMFSSKDSPSASNIQIVSASDRHSSKSSSFDTSSRIFVGRTPHILSFHSTSNLCSNPSSKKIVGASKDYDLSPSKIILEKTSGPNDTSIFSRLGSPAPSSIISSSFGSMPKTSFSHIDSI